MSMFVPVILVLILISHGTEALSIPADGCMGILSGNSCILIQGKYSAKSWNDARDACAQLGGQFVTVPDEMTQQSLAEVMTSEGVDQAWIGARENLGDLWYWVSDDWFLSPQGCYDDPTGDDLSQAYDVTDMTPARCIDVCASNNFPFAGLRGAAECRCGDTYSGEGITTGCTQPCAGNGLLDCGGFRKTFIYRTQGTWASWVINQPNNFGGSQHCAALDDANNFRFADELCDDSNLYVCDIPSASCPNSGGGGTMVRRQNGDCFFISRQLAGWAAARQDCTGRSGDLVQLGDEVAWRELTSLLQLYSVMISRFYWVGITRRTLQWVNGTSVHYTNWAPDSPNKSPSECIKLDSGAEHRWQDVDCGSRYPYFCEFELSPPTTTTTTTTTTPPPTTTSTTTTATTTTTLRSSTAATGPASSTPATGLSTPQINPGTPAPATRPTPAPGPPATPAPGPPATPAPGQTASVAPASNVTTEGLSTPEARKSTGGMENNILFISLIALVALLVLMVVVALTVFLCLRRKNNKNVQVLPEPCDHHPDDPSKKYLVHNGSEKEYMIRSEMLVEQQTSYRARSASPTNVHLANGHVPRDPLRVRICAECGSECRKLRGHLITSHELMPGTHDIKQSLSQGKTQYHRRTSADQVSNKTETTKISKAKTKKYLVCPECYKRTRRLADHLVRVHGYDTTDAVNKEKEAGEEF